MVVATPVLPRILRLSSCGAPSPPASSLRVLRRRCRRCAGAAGAAAGGLDGGIMRSAQPISGLRNDVAKKVLAKARGVWYFSVNIACSSGQTGERTSGRSQAEAQPMQLGFVRLSLERVCQCLPVGSVSCGTLWRSLLAGAAVDLRQFVPPRV